MALYCKAGERPIEVKPQNGKVFNLDELHKMVGGYIEVVRLSDGKYIVLDEEGKLKPDPQINIVCTTLAHISNAIRQGDYIVGDAVVCEPYEIN